MNPEFTVHLLNPQGIEKAQELAKYFDEFLNYIKTVVPEGRYLSLVKTHLETASFYSKKGMAINPENQKA